MSARSEYVDWKKLAEFERNNAERLCQHFLPQGKKAGSEWRIGDVSGQPGNSLGVQLTGEKAGLWHDRATSEGGNFHKLIAAARGYSEEEAVAEIERAFGVSFHGANGTRNHRENGNLKIMWEADQARAKKHVTDLSVFRGYTTEHSKFLIDLGLVGLTSRGDWATPVYDGDNSLVSEHIRRKEGGWVYSVKGAPVHPLVVGDLSKAKIVYAIESEWDLFASMQLTEWDPTKPIAFICTRGAYNARLIKGKFTDQATVIGCPQNDEPGKTWSDSIVEFANHDIRVLRTPQEYKDVNEWLKAGATGADFEKASQEAETLGAPPLDFSHYSVVDKPFPEPMQPAAFYGIIGETVRTIQAHTEACPEAVLVQLLAALGNVIGRSAYFYAGDSKHHARLWCVLVGDTSKGRKGSAYASVERLMREIAPAWVDDHFGTGLSSGEGLIYAVRDPRWGLPQRRTKNLPIEPTEELLDPGVSDKRYFVVEEEFSQVLRHLDRKGNTLSEVMRRAWDGKNLRITTKHCPDIATDPHISVIGHITREELVTCLNKSEAYNGFTNRFLWVASRRQQILPNSGFVPWQSHRQIIEAMRLILETFSSGNERQMARDPEAQKLWEQVYERLSAGRPGVLGAILGRAESQTLRLSMIYAIADRSVLIKRCHLEAALAVWDYCERSATWIFGTSTGDKMADKILWALQRRPNGMTRTEIQMEVFHRNAVKTDLDRALSTLAQSGFAQPSERSEANGRKSELWKII
jgi:hypothetical protein